MGLRTAWFMRRRIIECIQRYNPSFNAVAGDRVEIDETYFRDSYKGYRKGTMPRPARKSGKKAAKRGLSKQQVCVVTGMWTETSDRFLCDAVQPLDAGSFPRRAKGKLILAMPIGVPADMFDKMAFDGGEAEERMVPHTNTIIRESNTLETK
ncbi:hypothetical protein [Bifidobacterium moraviense]|uniref:Transposase n=1 Tax=Bifidobacterium miconis TaxID=2834435 RepID=A0ABS6WHF9_9BIFI|nr:hypothetical protein [Bifidobacterium sp. CP2]MBW3093190.1 hypothetical protein [Bifidobacterium miconis]